ncbi:hypothetical protein B0H17DRAFT_1127242 [Mycena rosella]|uniref:Uncharacterized protein n=1 Tax=Mycena rosella TaxID=1033263 RepID=A0AAD7E1A1_MYCRO|nr:hypothetical protein B0H17DRAFT_1127242 [Mycena rosella]
MDVRAKAKPPFNSSSELYPFSFIKCSLAPVLSSTPSITPATSWDGWPDRHLQYLFSPQEIAGTNQLEMDWVCELLPGKRGSPSVSVWQKAKEKHRQCLDILECSSHICSAKRQIAPALRGGSSRNRPLQTASSGLQL